MLRTWRSSFRFLLSPSALVVAFLLLLGPLPLLAEFARQSWLCPAWDVFPVLGIGAVLLALRRRDGEDAAPRPARGWCFLLLTLAWALLAVAGLLDSPSLGVVATLVTLAGVAAGVGGRAGL